MSVVASELHIQVQGNKFLGLDGPCRIAFIPTLMGRLVGRNWKAVEASLTLSCRREECLPACHVIFFVIQYIQPYQNIGNKNASQTQATSHLFYLARASVGPGAPALPRERADLFAGRSFVWQTAARFGLDSRQGLKLRALRLCLNLVLWGKFLGM